MSNNSTAIVWEKRAVDCGIYICRIEQDANKAARLTVNLQGYGQSEDLPIHSEPITIEVDASGNLIQDVDKWKSMCDDLIDFPKLRSSVANLLPWYRQ